MTRIFNLANWGTAIFMLRLPLAALDQKVVQTFTVKGVFEAEATKTHWICTWNLDESEETTPGSAWTMAPAGWHGWRRWNL